MSEASSGLFIGDQTYRPIPESWIEHGADAESGSPRLYAVSAAIERPSKLVYVRYAHPFEDTVLRASVAGVEHGDGIVPCPLANSQAEWSRSLVPSQFEEPTDRLRGPEREYFHDLWADRLNVLDAGVAADGGEWE